MAKAISSAADFLTAIAGKTEPFEVDGVTVELRSLEWAEVQDLQKRFAGNGAELTFQAAMAGLVTPKVEETQLRRGRAGIVADIGKQVMVLSGMTSEDGDRPLAGSGSSA